MKKLIGKVRPGLSLSSQQIRSRLRNKTIQKQQPENESFIQDEELIRISRMNKVEREMSHRETLKEMSEIQKRLEQSNDRKKQREIEQQIEKLANERLAQMRKDDTEKKEVQNHQI